MTRRLLVAVLLLHHVEGVCKPFSAAGDAARRLIAGFVDQALKRDHTAAVERARGRQAAAVERARALAAVPRQAPRVRRPAVLPRRRATRAIEPTPAVVDGLVYRITDAVERER